MLQFLEIGNLLMDIRQFFFQMPAHGRTRLQAAPSQFQEFTNFSQREPHVLHASNEAQRLHIVFAVLPETALRSGWRWEQCVALVEANRVNAETDPLANRADLHDFGSSRISYTLEHSPESSTFSGPQTWSHANSSAVWYVAEMGLLSGQKGLKLGHRPR